MIAIFNRLSVEKGATGQVVERFASSRGYVQGFPGFVSMEILSSEGVDKVLVVAR
jgi:heme-degrading monooxygenase HmoA